MDEEYTPEEQMVAYLDSKGIEADQLDELVQYLMSQKASAINYEGVESQVESIFGDHGYRPDQAAKEICEALNIEAPSPFEAPLP